MNLQERQMNLLNRLISSLAIFSLLFLFGTNVNAQDQELPDMEQMEQIFTETLEEIEIEVKAEEKKETSKETKAVVQENIQTPDVEQTGVHGSGS